MWKSFQDSEIEFMLKTSSEGTRLRQNLCVRNRSLEHRVGAVLSQKDESGDHPIAYFSRKLLPREEKYSVIEKECLAIKLACQSFQVYLLGRRFEIQTDHRALEWMDKLKENNARLTHWILALQPYSFTIKHRSGKTNGNADTLSRAPVWLWQDVSVAGEWERSVRDWTCYISGDYHLQVVWAIFDILCVSFLCLGCVWF